MSIAPAAVPEVTAPSTGLNFPNMIRVAPGDLDEKVRPLLPAYMTMGHTSMGEMGVMNMPVPKNSIPMRGGTGPFGHIDMGGMFTVLKVREALTSDEDPGWYVHPPGTVAGMASADELRQDGIAVPSAPPKAQNGGQHRH